MKRSLVLAASAFGLGCAALSSAQSGSAIDPTPSGISFRGGIVLPIDDDLRDVAKTWGAFGLDYTFTKQYLKNSETYIGLDYISRSIDGNRGTYWPLMVGQRFYQGGNALGENRTYFNAGLGVVFFDITGSDTRVGAKIGVGKEFGPNIFGEATMFWSQQSQDGINANSFGFWIGYRF
ncbi:MAG TPA: hypothetical protein PLX06_12790 [Fimbriimonadaceae bacterium]|nr:hypothetical protein [Fimbriimonadaceae bacterium]